MSAEITLVENPPTGNTPPPPTELEAMFTGVHALLNLAGADYIEVTFPPAIRLIQLANLLWLDYMRRALVAHASLRGGRR